MRKPYLKLRRRIEDEGLELKELSVQANIPYSTISKRLNDSESGERWLGREIIAICRVVGIPSNQIGEYFFPAIAKEEKTA